MAQQLLGFSSESRWIRYARAHLLLMFPTISTQSGYNKSVPAAGPLIAAAITALTRDTPSWHELLRLVDSTPVSCGMSRETVKRSDLAGHAGYGYCASHSRYFWGFRLYLISTPEGMPVTWGRANPKKGQLTLEDHGGRTIPGVYSRVAGRLLALAAGIWHNWLIGEPNKRSLIAYDHQDSVIQ